MNKKKILIIFLIVVVILSVRWIYRHIFVPWEGPEGGPYLEKWNISEQKAINMIVQLPEVDKFLKQGKLRTEDEYGAIVYNPIIMSDTAPTKEKPFWLISVGHDITEYNKNGEEISGHFNTQGLYKVNAITGKIDGEQGLIIK